jgi:cardiolipin synthase
MYERKAVAERKYSSNNKVTLIPGGKEYFDKLLYLINNASNSIQLQTYVFDDDETGTMVADALKAAVKRNVQVYLLADGYASQVMSNQFIHSLTESGIHFRFFEPFFKSKNFYFGRRLHHKIFVADEKFAIVGGVNIADRYNDMPGIAAWLDFAIYAEGEVVRELYKLCIKTWEGYAPKPGASPNVQEQYNYNFKPDETSLVRMRRNDWVRRKNEISGTYIEMLRNAKSHITIFCSYFLPGKIIRKLMQRAAKKGVKIRVITAGPSDVMLAKHAERWMYDWLLRNNIELYEYQPTVLHAKVAVCDGEWLTIGSYNINNISAYASIELNLDIRNANFAAATEKKLEDIIVHHCIPITKETHLLTKNILKQFVRWCSYQFIRIAFYLITFYYKQKG